MYSFSEIYAIRVECEPGIYCLIVSNDDETRDFYLINENYGDPVFMFGCKAEDDTHAAEIAYSNYDVYIPEEWEEE